MNKTIHAPFTEVPPCIHDEFESCMLFDHLETVKVNSTKVTLQ